MKEAGWLLMSKLHDHAPLSMAKQYVRNQISNGVECPCCGQYAKLYKRKLTSAMAIALLEIYKQNRKNNFEFFHVENHFKNLKGLPASIRGDFPKLRYWNLIEQQEGERDDGSNRNGFYRITGAGNAFIHDDQMKVFSHALIFNNKLEGFSENTVSFKECLGNKFNYDELMNS